MAVDFYKGHRDPRMLAYLFPQNNTKGRHFMNSVVIPRFAEFFKDGDTIYNIGQHVFWDYSVIFNNFIKRCNYLTTDTDPTQGQPDIIDDITDSKLPEASADGVMYVGMSDVVRDHPKAVANIYRILKPQGRLLFSFHGGGNTNQVDKSNLPSLFELLRGFIIDEMYFVYGPGGLQWGELYTNGDIESHFIICRKP